MPVPAPKKGSRASADLDLWRGGAAIAVLIEHARNLLLQDYGTGTSHNPLIKAFYFLSSFGHDAVMVFFVMSGFLITSSIRRSLVSNTWNGTSYFVNRASRLYAALVPCLVVGGLVDYIGVSRFSEEPVYSQFNFAHMFWARPDLSATTWIGNFAFLQHVREKLPVLGTNAPLWSLSNEFWYYILFPLLLFAARPKGNLLKAAVCGGLALLIGYMLWALQLWLFGIWLFGAAIPFLPQIKLPRLATPIAVVILAMVATAFRLHPLPLEYQIVSDWVTGFVFAVLVYFIACSPVRDAAVSYSRFSENLAAPSYTLYLAHVPLLALASASLFHGAQLPPTFKNLAIAGAVTLLVIPYTGILWFVGERNTGRLRNAMAGLLHIQSSVKRNSGVDRAEAPDKS